LRWDCGSSIRVAYPRMMFRCVREVYAVTSRIDLDGHFSRYRWLTREGRRGHRRDGGEFAELSCHFRSSNGTNHSQRGGDFCLEKKLFRVISKVRSCGLLALTCLTVDLVPSQMPGGASSYTHLEAMVHSKFSSGLMLKRGLDIIHVRTFSGSPLTEATWFTTVVPFHPSKVEICSFESVTDPLYDGGGFH